MTREEIEAFVTKVIAGTATGRPLTKQRVTDAARTITDKWQEDVEAAFTRGIEAEQAAPRYPFYKVEE